jgi:hypothetical protein
MTLAVWLSSAFLLVFFFFCLFEYLCFGLLSNISLFIQFLFFKHFGKGIRLIHLICTWTIFFYGEYKLLLYTRTIDLFNFFSLLILIESTYSYYYLLCELSSFVFFFVFFWGEETANWMNERTNEVNG